MDYFDGTGPENPFQETIRTADVYHIETSGVSVLEAKGPMGQPVPARDGDGQVILCFMFICHPMGGGAHVQMPVTATDPAGLGAICGNARAMVRLVGGEAQFLAAYDQALAETEAQAEFHNRYGLNP